MRIEENKEYKNTFLQKAKKKKITWDYEITVLGGFLYKHWCELQKCNLALRVAEPWTVSNTWGRSKQAVYDTKWQEYW